MTVYKADIRRGVVKILTAEVLGDADDQHYAIDPKNDISYAVVRIRKDSVSLSPEAAVERLLRGLGRGIERATKDINCHVRDIQRCHDWQLEQLQPGPQETSEGK